MVKKFAFFILFFEAIQLFLCKILGHFKSPAYFFLLIETPSLNGNEKDACFECGREHARLLALRHRRTCGVLKCSNINFHTYSSEGLTNHFKEKHCQHNANLSAQQSSNTLKEKVNLIVFF